ncbi:unnamed protein product [Cochlearia groenlandica]
MTSVRSGSHELNLASRRAEEAAARRFQAVQWLEAVVGHLGLPNQPTEKEFVSCLRNGMILCNAINKIHPGAVPKVLSLFFSDCKRIKLLIRVLVLLNFKVVESYSHMQSYNREYQLPQAYQYFENVRNFLVALQHLRLPGFEASDLEKDNLESGSVTKVVDCVLGLKAYHECKMTNGGNGMYKHIKTPTFLLSAAKIRPASASKASRHLDMSSVPDRNDCTDGESDKVKVIAKLFADHIFNSKENIDENLMSLENGSEDSRVNFQKIISRFPELQSVFKDLLNEGTLKPSDIESMPLEELPIHEEDQARRSLQLRTNSNRKCLLKTQEKELAVLKTLFIETKQDFKEFQVHLQRDLMELGNQMQEMSSAAQGYYKVVEENRKLYNMVQDLKGNIRVFCRVRPIFNTGTKGVIDYIGKDGSLFVVDPSKQHKDARKTFQFNQVFSATATQDDVFLETQPLIRSVMDGYNVCIFAYGQTGSGKTYTMSGPPDIRTCSSEDDGLCLPDATMHSVNSTMDVLQLMEAGEVNRAVSSTSMNNRSSRSHSILMVHVRGKDTSGGTLSSCLHLVDLAGSERVDKSEVTGDRLKEALYINKSLSCLGDVISALAQKNSHIPYRNSKLTLLLQDSLGGQAKTLMFAHLSPEEDSFAETMSTLKFAQRVSTVELGAARAHKETREVMHLKEQIENLKKALVAEECNNTSYSGARDIKSPFSRQIATTERTPTRLRRLSIENCSNTRANLDDRRGIKSPLASRRAQRMILEGPKSCKNEGQGKGDPTMEVQQHLKNPRSPVSSYQNRTVKVDGRTSIPELQLLQTPDKESSNDEIQVISADSKTHGKGSQIRKSLRTIGKLINGSDKRKENIPVDPRSPLGVSSNFSGLKSPHTSNAKTTLRRQSLTGVMPSGPERSRRSSIGGNQIENGVNGARNAKTPPPMRSSSKIMKKWA